MPVDKYMRIDSIQGECTDSNHIKCIEVSGFTHELIQPVSAASGTVGRTCGLAEFGDFAITKLVDCATPEHSIHCTTGKHIPTI